MSNTDSEPDHKALLESIHERLINERRQLVARYHDEDQIDPVGIVSKITEVQHQIEAMERAINSETTRSSSFGIMVKSKYRKGNK